MGTMLDFAKGLLMLAVIAAVLLMASAVLGIALTDGLPTPAKYCVCTCGEAE